MLEIPVKITSKWQVTVPRQLRRLLKIPQGATLLFGERDGALVARPQLKRRELKIFALRGSLRHLDDGRPTEAIIEEAKRRAAYEIATGRPWTAQSDARRRARH